MTCHEHIIDIGLAPDAWRHSTLSAMQEWGPDVCMFDSAFPTGAPVADLLHIPKVAMWVSQPLVSDGGGLLRGEGSCLTIAVDVFTARLE